MSIDETIEIKDKSKDRQYYVMVPRLVLLRCKSPFELTLWNVIKSIAGEGGSCYISTNDLASLSMMSMGMVSKCRQSLIDLHLLEGQLYRDPGYPQPVWHLSIPDLWKDNLDLCRGFTLKEMIEFKASQKELSPHESSKELSQSEKGISPHERGISPHETKYIKKEELKEEKEELACSQTSWVMCLIDLSNRSTKPAWTHNFKEYFEPTYLLATEDHKYIIACPDEAHRAWLVDNGKDLIERELIGVTGEKITAEFVVKP